VAFGLVTVLGAVTAAWSSADSASSALVAAAQQQITGTIAEQITAIAPQLTYPPDQSTLDRLRLAVGADTLVTYRDLSSSQGPDVGLVTDELRNAVRGGMLLVTERIPAGGRSWLLVGTPVTITAPDGTRTPSGVEVYSVRDLTAVQRQIDALTRRAGV